MDSNLRRQIDQFRQQNPDRRAGSQGMGSGMASQPSYGQPEYGQPNYGQSNFGISGMGPPPMQAAYVSTNDGFDPSSRTVPFNAGSSPIPSKPMPTPGVEIPLSSTVAP